MTLTVTGCTFLEKIVTATSLSSHIGFQDELSLIFNHGHTMKKRNLIVGELYKVHASHVWFSDLTGAKSDEHKMVFFLTEPKSIKIPSDAVLLYLGHDLIQFELSSTKYTSNFLKFLWSKQSSNEQTACQAIEVGIESSTANLFTKIS